MNVLWQCRGMRTIKEIEHESADVAQELVHLEAKRAELKVRTSHLSRKQDVCKRELSHMLTHDVDLLHQVGGVKRRLHDLKLEMKAVTTAASHPKVEHLENSVAQKFVKIAKKMLPPELYQEILHKANAH